MLKSGRGVKGRSSFTTFYKINVHIHITNFKGTRGGIMAVRLETVNAKKWLTFEIIKILNEINN